MVWTPPIEPWSAKDKNSFAYESTVKRWPSILTQCIDGLYQASYALSYSRQNQSARIEEGKAIIEALSKIKHDMGRDRPLEKIADDGGPSLKMFHEVIEREKPTWFTASWLFAECYLYRLIRSFFQRSQYWQRYDPFSSQKLKTFKSSGAAITTLAGTIQDLVTKAEKSEQGAAESDEGRKILFNEMAQMSLWGNATDLSLLTSLSYEDIQALQTTGREQQEARSKFILANDLDAAWDCLSKMKNGRVDFVLDNAGFELVSDLMFADWLVSCTPYVSEVVFHAKNIPWFVSDVTPPDFTHTITSLLEPAFFSSDSNGQAAEEDDLPSRVERHRSISRSRQPVVDPSVYAEGKPRTPSRSRDLKMDENDMRGRQPTTASTARDLKMREGSLGGARNNHPAGSRALQMDPAYFKNARSRTISPTRSYVMDTTSFSALSIHEEGKASEDQTHSRSASGANAAPQLSNVQAMAQRWQRYLNEGRFKLSVPLDTQLGQSTGQQGDFWTEPVGYADMAEQAPELVKELQKAGLVIFKGDLNYRKLTSDLRWPSTTPFKSALGPFASHLPLLALRTCKADVCVGLKEGSEEWLDKEDPKWRVDGKWAVVQFCPREV